MTKTFWQDLIERAVSTFFQTLLALVGVNQTAWVTLDWAQIAATSGIAAGLAVAKGLAAFKFSSTPTPSITNTYDYES
jgi:Putative lactococcus lactis phage r1t holin